MSELVPHDRLIFLAVVLIFGASAFSPREVFVVDVGKCERLGDPSEPLAAGEASPLPRSKVLRLCAQKLIRALIMDVSERFTRCVLARPITLTGSLA